MIGVAADFFISTSARWYVAKSDRLERPVRPLGLREIGTVPSLAMRLGGFLNDCMQRACGPYLMSPQFG